MADRKPITEKQALHFGVKQYTSDLTTSSSLSRQFGHLLVKVAIQDISRSDREAWNLDTNGVYSSKWRKRDSCCMLQTFQYSFNTTRSKYRGTGAENDEKSRL